MMQDLIKTFTTYAGPNTDAQRKQYQRMLDLTRSAANARAGLYDAHLTEKELFIELHLAELKALAYSNDRNGIKAKYHCFEPAIQQCRNNQCCQEQCRADLLATETALLKAIHKLETESWLDRLGYAELLSIGIPLISFAIIVILFLLGFNELPDRLNQAIGDALPTVVNDSLGLMLVLVLPIIVSLLVVFLLLKRVWSHLGDG